MKKAVVLGQLILYILKFMFSFTFLNLPRKISLLPKGAEPLGSTVHHGAQGEI